MVPRFSSFVSLHHGHYSECNGVGLQLICTITPASSNNEETHNTLKFAHRAKRIEIHAASNWVPPYCILLALGFVY
jgi:hypothetical protein